MARSGAQDELLEYIQQHERVHGDIDVSSVPSVVQRRDDASTAAASKLRQSAGGSPREWGVPVGLQAGATSAKVALGLGTPQASPERGEAVGTRPQPLSQSSSTAAQSPECHELAPTPPRESKLVAAARLALASPSAASVPSEVLLGAYRWQRRTDSPPLHTMDAEFTWNSSAANLMDVLESPVSSGSSLTVSNPLVDLSTEDEAVIRGMSNALSRSDVLSATELSAPPPAETRSSRKQRPQPARRKQRRRAMKPASEASGTSDSSVAPSSEERSATRQRPRRQAKKKSTLVQKRAAKIRAIVKDAREDHMLRPDLRCTAPNPPQQHPTPVLRSVQRTKSTKHVKAQRPAVDNPQARSGAAKAGLQTIVPAADTATREQLADARQDAELQGRASPRRPSDPAQAALVGSSAQLNETQLEVYHTIGELRDRRDSILRSRSEDYYIRAACGPDPYIDRLVATVLALPRPQLSPPEVHSSMSADEVTLPAATSETLVQDAPENALDSALVEEKAVLTESCIQDNKSVQTAVDSHSQLADLSQVSDKAAQTAGDETRQMQTLGTSKKCGAPSVPSVRRPLPPSPRRWGEHGCRDQQPQPTEAVELCIVTGCSVTRNHRTVCSSMTGVVDGMPVGPNASAVTSGGSRVLRAVQRTHSTPPRRKSGHQKRRLNATTPHFRKSEQVVEDTKNSIDVVVECKETDAGGSPLSVSLVDSSEGESELVSPARRITVIEASGDSDRQLHQLVSRDAAKEAFAAMESFSPVESNTSTCRSPVAASTGPETETQTYTRWSNIPVGETEDFLRASPATTGSPSMLSPTSFQHVSGCSDAVSVPSDPGQETLSPVQQHIRLQKVAVDVAGSWQAVMKEIVPKSPPVQKIGSQTLVSLEEPPTGSDLEELYAQHKRAVGVEAQSAQTLCYFELQQLGDDFVTGYHAQTSEPFYIRDGRITYAQQKGELPGVGPVVVNQAATLSFVQVFPDNGECKWSARIELGPPAPAVGAVPGKGRAKSSENDTDMGCSMCLALSGGTWSRSGGNLGTTVRHGTFEARRCTDQDGTHRDIDAINHSGDTNESLEQSSLSSFSSNASTVAGSGHQMQEQSNLSSDSDTLTASMIEEAAGRCSRPRTTGDYDDSADDLSSVSMETVLASLAKVKETLVQSHHQQQQQQQQQQQDEDEDDDDDDIHSPPAQEKDGS